jgi:hypothetical protein
MRFCLFRNTIADTNEAPGEKSERGLDEGSQAEEVQALCC